MAKTTKSSVKGIAEMPRETEPPQRQLACSSPLGEAVHSDEAFDRHRHYHRRSGRDVIMNMS